MRCHNVQEANRHRILPKRALLRAQGNTTFPKLPRACQNHLNMTRVLRLFPHLVHLVRLRSLLSVAHGELPTENPANGPYSSVQNTIEYHSHDMRSQQINVGIDPVVFADMVSKARKMVQESEDIGLRVWNSWPRKSTNKLAFASKSWSKWLKICTHPIATKLAVCSFLPKKSKLLR